MRIRHVAAAFVALSCAIFTASCLQSPTATPGTDDTTSLSIERVSEHVRDSEPIGEARQEASGPSYVSEDFPFVVTVKDDGKDEGAGWQRAENTSHFRDLIGGVPVYVWRCRLEIGMPLRTVKQGRISPDRAALITAQIANEVAFPLLDSRESWEGQGAVFCIELKAGMQAMFRKRHREIGARVELK
jgi:hypothetical protein